MRSSGKFVVVGSTGLIGSRLTSRFQGDGIPYVGTSTTGRSGSVKLDLQDVSAFDIGLVRPDDIVVFLGAISRPDICRDQPDFVRRVNVEGPAEFIELALARGARVLFASSDAVYGNTLAPLLENGTVSPVGDYAEMKAAVERAFEGRRGFVSMRFSYAIARDDKFTAYLRNCVESSSTAEIFDPLVRCPIYIEDIVSGIIRLGREDNIDGLSPMNFGGPASLSRTEMTRLFCETVGSTLGWRVVPPPSGFFDARPKIIEMNSSRLAGLLGRPLTALGAGWSKEFSAKKDLGKA